VIGIVAALIHRQLGRNRTCDPAQVSAIVIDVPTTMAIAENDAQEILISSSKRGHCFRLPSASFLSCFDLF
jgi:hypothetical protein